MAKKAKSRSNHQVRPGVNLAQGKEKTEVERERMEQVIRSNPKLAATGSALLCLSAMFFFTMIVQIITVGFNAPFALSYRFLVLVVAVVILGASFQILRSGPVSGNRRFIIPLIVAALIIASRALPSTPLLIMEQYWLPTYGFACLIFALLLRRKMASVIG